jgi:hypothetical protein
MKKLHAKFIESSTKGQYHINIFKFKMDDSKDYYYISIRFNDKVMKQHEIVDSDLKKISSNIAKSKFIINQNTNKFNTSDMHDNVYINCTYDLNYYWQPN